MFVCNAFELDQLRIDSLLLIINKMGLWALSDWSETHVLSGIKHTKSVFYCFAREKSKS